MLIYWHHYARNGRRIEVERFEDSIAAHFLHLLHGTAPSDLSGQAMQTSLILYAEHEFNASTFTARVIAGTGSDIYSCIAGAIGALRGPKHGGANEVALEIQKRYRRPTKRRPTCAARVGEQAKSSSASATRSTPSATHATTSSRKSRASSAPTAGNMRLFNVAERIENHDARRQAHVPQPRLVQAVAYDLMGVPRAISSRRSSSSPGPPAGVLTSSSSARTARSSAPPPTTPARNQNRFVPIDQRS